MIDEPVAIVGRPVPLKVALDVNGNEADAEPVLKGLPPFVRGITGALELVWPCAEGDGRRPDSPISPPAEFVLKTGRPVPAELIGTRLPEEAAVGPPAEVPKEYGYGGSV